MLEDNKNIVSAEWLNNNLTHPDLVILAGFMRILSNQFVQSFSGRLINIHPSLLPKYPGLHTHQRALANQDKYHGSSVHFVTEELDCGPIIAQTRFNLDLNSNEPDTAKRVQSLEHKLYPQVSKWILDGQITIENDNVLHNGAPLQQPIIIES